MRRLIINKQLIIPLSLAFVIFVVIFLLNYTWVSVNNSSNEQRLIEIIDLKSNVVKEFELGKGSKTVFLKKDSYFFEVSAGNKLSTYKKSLGFPGRNKLQVELIDQKNSAYLGKSNLPCAVNNGQERLFYSCNFDDSANSIISSQRGVIAYKSSAEEPYHGETGTAVLQNYQDGFIDARITENQLLISLRETKSGGFARLDNFNGILNNDTFSISLDSDNFAVYDIKNSTLAMFKNISDTKPFVVQVPKSEHSESVSTKIVAAKDYVYVINYALDTHEHGGGEKAEQTIFSYSTSTNKLVKKYILPEDAQVQQIVSGFNNQFLLIVGGNRGSQVLMIKGTAPPDQVLEVAAKSIQAACWKDKDNFYYLTNGGKNIFSYSISKKASFLVYGGLSENKYVDSIKCTNGSLYVVFNQTQGKVENKYFGYHHFMLTDGVFEGTRLEAVLPVFVNVDTDVIEAYFDSPGVKVEVKYDEDNNPATPSKEKTRDTIVEELENNGVVTENIKFNFSF